MSDREALEAGRLKNDPAFQKAVAMLHEVYHKEWQEASTTEARERIWNRDAALTAVETELSKAVDNGTFETTQQERRDKRRSDT